MGYMRHHAIVVTSLDEKIEPLHAKAVEIFGTTVTAIVDSKANGYRSFLVAPDGSKEGRDESNHGDRRREPFITWLTQRIQEDPWAPLNWIQVQYGDDNDDTRILGDSSAIARNAQESSN